MATLLSGSNLGSRDGSLWQRGPSDDPSVDNGVLARIMVQAAGEGLRAQIFSNSAGCVATIGGPGLDHITVTSDDPDPTASLVEAYRRWHAQHQ